MNQAKKKVAGIVTEYRLHAHADVILTKILEGYNHDGGEGPNLKLVSMYVDQFPEKEMSRDLAKKHGFKIYDSIDGAVTLGGTELAVDGVLCIGEHGKHPTNDRGQILYPRRKFFEGVIEVFAKSKRSVPVFNDKHLSATWEDAKWMYDKAKEHFVPLLAGLHELVPWLWQWHGEYDAEWDGTPAKEYEDYLTEQRDTHRLTVEALTGWRPERTPSGCGLL